MGTVHGLLDSNGAGKTTVVQILSTLARSDSGRARVAGPGWSVSPSRYGAGGTRASGVSRYRR
jgi:ABC-2 type transport system ATP-binding protein